MNSTPTSKQAGDGQDDASAHSTTLIVRDKQFDNLNEEEHHEKH